MYAVWKQSGLIVGLPQVPARCKTSGPLAGNRGGDEETRTSIRRWTIIRSFEARCLFQNH